LSCLCLVRYALCFRLYMPLPSHLPFLFFLRRPPTSPLFPYTTLFRSRCSFGSILTRRYSRSSHVPVTSSCVQSCLQISRLRSKRSEEHTSELQSRFDLVCRLLLEKKKKEGNSDKGIIRTSY